LKPLPRALEDRDRIRAVILGSAINSDGTGAALTAPNSAAHTALIERAWRRAGVSPESISYIEAHGTGTALGDPIEVKGITDAVRKYTRRRQFIALGSVKGNIGHLVDGAAGLSGLVKTMQVLEHGCVPPTVNLSEPNEHIDFLDSPVFVPTGLHDLRDGTHEAPLRAGVSCFGFNGTNVHAVLAEAPRVASSESGEPQPVRDLVFPLSAKTRQALRALMAAHGGACSTSQAPSAQDLAFTLATGREHFGYRLAIIARTVADFGAACSALAAAPDDQWAAVRGVVTTSGAGDLDGFSAASVGLATAYVEGGQMRWAEQLAGARPSVVTLPCYPFDELSYWVTEADGPEPRVRAAGQVGGSPSPVQGEALLDCLAAAGTALGYDDVQPDDSFIGRGGSSLAALQVQAALRKSYGW
jgi:acyl transferase domain-containing protein